MKIVHQPLLVTSSSGRNDVMKSPMVGTVQRMAITIAASEAHGEVSALCALLATVLACLASTAVLSGPGRRR